MSIKDLFGQDLEVINLGLKSLHSDLKTQGVKSVHVNWKPKAGGKKNMLNLLSKINKVKKL